MATRTKKKAISVEVPQTDAEAQKFIAKIGQLQRARKVIETTLNDQIATLQNEADQKARPLAEEINDRLKGLQTYGEANRKRLTQGGKVKFHRFTSGEISWRMRPKKVTLKGVVDIIEACKKLGKNEFLRTKEEVDKDAMLKDENAAESIKGVTINQSEDFIVKPNETELEEVV
ncbi:MAG: host-nuclease inhibitor Gam family protein [Rhodospirillales bacterium]|nr:host-nuclease inhibitor Gam family protein [Rhodospirillales bacterium]